MFNLILFGPPGSGKGTQSEKLAGKYDLVHLSTGNLLREERSQKTPLGIEAESFVSKGQLVPDEVVIGMVDSFFDKHKDARGFLFDGFPRTLMQAEALDKLLGLRKTEISAILVLDVKEEELIRRLIERGKTSGRSDDSDESVIRKRLAVYHAETAPVEDHYKRNRKPPQHIKGEGSIDNIFNSLSDALDKKMKKVS